MYIPEIIEELKEVEEHHYREVRFHINDCIKLQKEIDDRLAKALLSGEIHDGDTVRVDLADDASGLTVAPFSLE
jgi:hypothetical protein